MEVDIFYIRRHQGYPESSRFHLIFRGVQSVRAHRYVSPPVPEAEGEMPSEEQIRLLNEAAGKSRLESLGWGTLESEVAEEYFDVLEAELAETPEGVTLHLEGTVGGGGPWHQLYVCARALHLRRDAEALPLDAFAALGEAYWEAFAAGRSETE